MSNFDDHLRVGLRSAAHSIVAPPSLDGLVQDRIARRRRQTRRREVAAAAVLVVVIGGSLAAVAGRNGVTPQRVQAGSQPVSPLTGPAGVWRRLPRAPIGARYQHLTLWTGKQMLVWGGVGNSGPSLADGATYDPATGLWSRLPPAPINGRAGPVGVWTGKEALIFGGVTNTSQPPDGAGYDPATHTWRHLRASPLGNLTNSGSYVAWTGSRVVAWGFFNDGAGSHGGGSLAVGIYDPATGRWSQGATAPADAPLFGDALWTGSELLVVGSSAANGIDKSPSQKMVALAYKPSTDTWRQLPPPPIAGGRENMLAAWSGQQLVIGGGYGNGRLNTDAAAYSPATDTWRALPAAPVGFTGSNRFSELWTGHEVVSLDDADGQGRPLFLNPAAGQWRFGPPLPTTAKETAPIWTGRDILVWGGGLPIQVASATTPGAPSASGCCNAVATGAALQPGP